MTVAQDGSRVLPASQRRRAAQILELFLSVVGDLNL